MTLHLGGGTYIGAVSFRTPGRDSGHTVDVHENKGERVREYKPLRTDGEWAGQGIAGAMPRLESLVLGIRHPEAMPSQEQPAPQDQLICKECPEAWGWRVRASPTVRTRL